MLQQNQQQQHNTLRSRAIMLSTSRPQQMQLFKQFEQFANYVTKDQLAKALLVLNETSIPRKIPCRDEQKQLITRFVSEGIKTRGRVDTLYISGAPGIGKTLTVREVLRSIRESNPDSFLQVSVNALNLSKPEYVYTSILFELTRCKLQSSERAMVALDHIFRTGTLPQSITSVAKRQALDFMRQNSNKTKIIFIDELDYLYTRSENVLYNLFEWAQHSTTSRIVMIAVSNTIDFPEKLQQKIQSRFGQTRIVFRPYTHDQIEIIVKDRLEATSVFSEESVKYACSKIARFSGDIRKTLSVLRSALEIHMQLPESSDKISFQTLNQAHNQVYCDHLINSVPELIFNDRKVLAIICKLIQSHGKSCYISEVMRVYESRNIDVRPYEKVVLASLHRLKDRGIVKFINITRLRDNRPQMDKIKIMNYVNEYLIELDIDMDKILQSLRDSQDIHEYLL